MTSSRVLNNFALLLYRRDLRDDVEDTRSELLSNYHAESLTTHCRIPGGKTTHISIVTESIRTLNKSPAVQQFAA